MEGSPAHFEAKLVPIGDSKLRVNWLKNGKPIQCSNRMSTLNDFGFVALDLKYTRTDDSGAYTCNAINELGEANITANLKVCQVESVQDFLIKFDIKPLMHLLEISTFSLNNVIVRLTKIMNRADKNWAHF